ncbi:MAG TPA: HEAT repeat domain-containing protein [Verrucomicrobiae bacterium]
MDPGVGFQPEDGEGRLHSQAGQASVRAMRGPRLVLVVLMGSAAALCCVGGIGARERLYEGKPLDRWLDAGYEDVSRVCYEVGPVAAEAIFTKLKREHPRYGRWGHYRTFWDKMPLFCRKFLPRPRVSGFDEWRACHALLAIGPQVVPSLTVSLSDRHYLVRSVSAQTLGMFRQRGNNIRGALPALRVALRDPDVTVQEQAAAAVGADLKAGAAAGRTGW